ncbi:MAG: hypothetical protein GWN55_03865 [Phycisphaerae bacterium]|nr:hypothetical protein [Phycisphaerae bacterium]NIU24173.1 hypothetical protein [candidate division KSB1 bacterium]NIP55095.1 hypothetical protein [Phycisphaerae bacterium]NIU11398.1 hypothetical protein [Phycisphaerae bacterium]NIV00458.1 hypothetical protein [Phycisphaerae bacterium]
MAYVFCVTIGILCGIVFTELLWRAWKKQLEKTTRDALAAKNLMNSRLHNQKNEYKQKQKLLRDILEADVKTIVADCNALQKKIRNI